MPPNNYINAARIVYLPLNRGDAIHAFRGSMLGRKFHFYIKYICKAHYRLSSSRRFFFSSFEADFLTFLIIESKNSWWGTKIQNNSKCCKNCGVYWIISAVIIFTPANSKNPPPEYSCLYMSVTSNDILLFCINNTILPLFLNLWAITIN